jgi:ribose transport system permease protein
MKQPKKEMYKKLLLDNVIYCFFILLFIICAIASPNFTKPMNIFNLIRQYTPFTLLSIGMLVVVLTGGIDLSVGSNIAFINVVFAIMITNHKISTFSALALTLLIGIGIGALNGYLVAYRRLPAFIATLAIMSIFKSLAFVLTNANTIRYNSPVLKSFGLGALFGLPSQFYVLLITVAIFFFMLRNTSFGRLIYATGSNQEAVILSGINHKLVIFSVYCICGLCAAISGISSLSRMNVATATLGSGYELDAIAGCVIGGTSMSGGKGSALKTVCGVFVLAMIGNIMNLLGIPNYPQNAIKGVIIILAVLFQNKK